MKKYLRVDIERGIAGEDVTVFHPLDGDETEADRKQTAADIFQDKCNYGFSVVDESDVPEDQRV